MGLLKPRTVALIARAKKNRAELKTSRARKSVANVYRKARKALGSQKHRENISKRFMG